jgi:molybdopterin molybdotransferase
MITVQEAEGIILNELRDYGTEDVSFHHALGRTLAEDLCADRDIPAFDRVTMDGIAIRYSAFAAGKRTFRIKGIQAAGETPIQIDNNDDCIEIMTGAALPGSTDTVVRYEDVEIANGHATVLVDELKYRNNIHEQGSDEKSGAVLVRRSTLITPAIISVAASVGAHRLTVKSLPKVVIISTGNELVDIEDLPSAYQLRRSNNYAMRAVLQRQGIDAAMLHLPDDQAALSNALQQCLQQYDVLLLSGGVSMGKFDFVPAVLQELQVTQLFHKVKQKPGKPFWFGKHSNGAVVFGFPGNPVSAFMCVHRHFIPWLQCCLQIPNRKSFAVLQADLNLPGTLEHFVLVKLELDDKGLSCAIPLDGNGSGDFTSLLMADAFMQLPVGKSNYQKGEVYQVWNITQ